MNLRPWAISLAAILAAGCGGPAPEEAASEGEPTENRVLLDYAERPLERARGVEDLSLQRKDGLDEEIGESER